jgi:protein-L-isoaspartate(D-aspartate) O-methyltransferase
LTRRTVVACTLGALLTGAACRPAASDPPAHANFAAARVQMLDDLRAHGITDARVLDALARVRREEFVRPEDRNRAYTDQALPIGGGQTISQPYVVALMTQLLALRGGERVLEIGTGSGYQAALLALLAHEVYSIEIDAALADTARQRLQRLGYANVRVRVGDGFYGWEEAAPFDAMIVTAAAPKVPERLVAQLKPEGRLIIPLGDADHQTLMRATKHGDHLELKPVTEVLFVPMVGAIRNPATP